jgi:hypothetical protein
MNLQMPFVHSQRTREEDARKAAAKAANAFKSAATEISEAQLADYEATLSPKELAMARVWKAGGTDEEAVAAAMLVDEGNDDVNDTPAARARKARILRRLLDLRATH